MSNSSWTTTASFKFGYKGKTDELKEFLDQVPEGSEFTINHYEGDQRDPTENTITVTWEIRKREQ